jgi:hypothetical protein
MPHTQSAKYAVIEAVYRQLDSPHTPCLELRKRCSENGLRRERESDTHDPPRADFALGSIEDLGPRAARELPQVAAKERQLDGIRASSLGGPRQHSSYTGTNILGGGQLKPTPENSLLLGTIGTAGRTEVVRNHNWRYRHTSAHLNRPPRASRALL